MSSEAQKNIQKTKSAFFWSMGSLVLGLVIATLFNIYVHPPLTESQELIVIITGVLIIVIPSTGLYITLRRLKNVLMEKIERKDRIPD